MANPFFKFRITNVSTGEVHEYYEDQIEIEICGDDAMVSVMTPSMGSREFLLNTDELERAKSEVRL